VQEDRKTPPSVQKAERDYLTRPFTEVTDRGNRELLLAYRLALRAENASLATITHYCGATRDFMIFAEQHELPGVRETSTVDLRQWIAAMQDNGAATATIKNRYVGCRLFFKWLIEEEELDTPNPFDKIKRPKVEVNQKRVVEPEEFQRLFKHLDAKKRWRDAALIAFLYDTGMRASETCNLPTDNVNLDTGLVRIEALATKGKRSRQVRVSPQTLVRLNRYLRHEKDRRKEPEFLFNGTKGALTRSGMLEAVERCFAEIGLVGGIGVHTLRHSAATAQAGILSETEMMDIFGWKDADMARHYTASARVAVALAAQERSWPMAALGRRR
jgi:integrase/recombinase XerC